MKFSRFGLVSIVLLLVLGIAGCLRVAGRIISHSSGGLFSGDSGSNLTASGTREQSITVDGDSRTFLVHTPNSYDSRGGMPLVIVLHGGFGNSERMMQITGFNEISDREGFIAVYPQGQRKHWVDGREEDHFGATGEKDVHFISSLIDEAARQFKIDRRRVYVTGMSNGAIMSYRLACELSSQIAAIAPVSGTMGASMGSRCHPKQPVSVLHIHGTADTLVEWQGGGIANNRLPGRVWSVPQTIQFWVKENGCSITPQTELEPDRDPTDRTRVKLTTYPNCRDGSEVELYTIEQGGHAWPGSTADVKRFAVTGRMSKDINASKLIWQFFKNHRR